MQETTDQDINTLLAAGSEHLTALFTLMDEVDVLKPPLIAANVLGKEFLAEAESEGVVTAMTAYDAHAADLAVAYAAAGTYTANLKKRLLQVSEVMHHSSAQINLTSDNSTAAQFMEVDLEEVIPQDVSELDFCDESFCLQQLETPRTLYRDVVFPLRFLHFCALSMPTLSRPNYVHKFVTPGMMESWRVTTVSYVDDMPKPPTPHVSPVNS